MTTNDITSRILHWNSACNCHFTNQQSNFSSGWKIWAPASYTPHSQPHLHNVATRVWPTCEYCYHSFSNFDGHSKNQLKYVHVTQTMYKQTLKCKLVWLQEKQSLWYCKTIGKNLHRHLSMQVTQERLNKAVHSSYDFNLCGLIELAAFIISIRVWAVNGLPLPIPHVTQQLLPHVWAVCQFRAGVWVRVIYLHTRQSKFQRLLCHKASAKIWDEFWYNNAVLCEFWQYTTSQWSISEGNLAPTVFTFQFAINRKNYVQQTKQ